MLASIELTLLIWQVNFATLYRYGKINFISNTNLHISNTNLLICLYILFQILLLSLC